MDLATTLVFRFNIKNNKNATANAMKMPDKAAMAYAVDDPAGYVISSGNISEKNNYLLKLVKMTILPDTGIVEFGKSS